MKRPEIPDELDAEKLAEVALGLLALTIHDGSRAWKGLDWGVMNLLYERGWIQISPWQGEIRCPDRYGPCAGGEALAQTLRTRPLNR